MKLGTIGARENDARGLTWGVPTTACSQCGAVVGGSKRRACPHLLTAYAADIAPCSCPASHLWDGIDVVIVEVVRKISGRETEHRCVRCGEHWITTTVPGGRDVVEGLDEWEPLELSPSALRERERKRRKREAAKAAGRKR